VLPNQLTSDSFSKYPPEAREVARQKIGLLLKLPLGFLPLLLRELIAYDWKFPAERRELNQQLAYLSALSPDQLSHVMAAFASLRLTSELEHADWVNEPARFSEQLTAHLWATHQIDSFRTAAVEYVEKSTAYAPAETLPVSRLGIALIGEGVDVNQYRLFRKLRPHGVYYTRVKPEGGFAAILQTVSRRAVTHPAAYAHWCIEGAAMRGPAPGLTCVSWDALTPVRAALQQKMQKVYGSGLGPEAFRTMLAQMRPEDLGAGAGKDPVLDRFQLSLLTEGSGTQVFSTTFVQWAAREALRRAQPLTILARFAQRQRERPMNELLSETQRKPEMDPQGSLVDADMGAYYTWLNLQRLSGSGQAAFLVWFEGHNEAVAVSPRLGRGVVSAADMDITAILTKMGVG
jgi:hypothetical protein